MPAVIRVIAFANGVPCPIAGQYLESFDFNAYRGRGFGTFVIDPRQAKHFASKAAAMVYWRTVSSKYPVRADGQPNRPLTATTCEIVDLEEQ
jgi:hypothetical protein